MNLKKATETLSRDEVYHASDLVLVMTSHPEFERSAKLRVSAWSPDRITGDIYFIDGRVYKLTVEVKT